MSAIWVWNGVPTHEIWARARELEACVVTKDEDFILLQALDRAGPAIVWIRIGNAVRSVLLRRLPLLWPTVISSMERGEKVIEVR
jgi:predicted nuclease of predicted toxin-antitoxin system